MGSVERGRAGEELAAIFLQLQGLRLLDRNRRAAGGEIDLILRDADTLVFAEVRLRRHGQWVPAAASITADKRRRLRACAAQLAQRTDLLWPRRRLRFDVVLIELRASGLELWHHRNVRLS